MNLVNDIEDRVTCDGEAVVACSHGSNRSFFMVNLYFQKRFDLSYEEVRQLMTAHRGLKDGPLHHSTSAAEPPEFLKRKFTHSTRPSVPLSKRYIHEARWNVPGLEYSDLLAYMRVEDGDTSTDSSEEEEGEEEEGGLEREPLAGAGAGASAGAAGGMVARPAAATVLAMVRKSTPAAPPPVLTVHELCMCDGCWTAPGRVGVVAQTCVAAQRRAQAAAAPALGTASAAAVSEPHPPSLVSTSKFKQNRNYVMKGRFSGRRGSNRRGRNLASRGRGGRAGGRLQQLPDAGGGGARGGAAAFVQRQATFDEDDEDAGSMLGGGGGARGREPAFVRRQPTHDSARQAAEEAHAAEEEAREAQATAQTARPQAWEAEAAPAAKKPKAKKTLRVRLNGLWSLSVRPPPPPLRARRSFNVLIFENGGPKRTANAVQIVVVPRCVSVLFWYGRGGGSSRRGG